MILLNEGYTNINLIFWTNVMRTENGFCIGVKSVVEPGDSVTGSIRKEYFRIPYHHRWYIVPFRKESHLLFIRIQEACIRFFHIVWYWVRCCTL